MKFKYFIVPALLIAVISCNKNKYQTKPSLSIESITTTVVPGGTFTAVLQYTQKTGDLGGGTFISLRKRLNQAQLLPGTGNADTIVTNIPSFPNAKKGQINFTLDYYTSIHESDIQNDTFQFKFAVIDAAGNKSDTILSPIVVSVTQ